MKSIKTIYKYGHGPSSSHTVAPSIATNLILKKYPEVDKLKVTLYGSLCLTGKGHGTDSAIKAIFNNTEFVFDINKKEEDLPHPNTMEFEVYSKGELIAKETVLSIGGGEVKFLNDNYISKEIYSEENFTEVLDYCKSNNLTLPEFIYQKEGEEIKESLRIIWQQMKECIKSGLENEGELPGDLHIQRKAKMLNNLKIEDEGFIEKEDRLIASYAYAVSEENAAGHKVVIAPTCGASGVLPAVLYFLENERGYSEDKIIDGLAVAGLIGNIIRKNASISGAECGCQAEIGSACSMAAAAKAQINNMNLEQIEYAAEVAMEHQLGLTCDPVHGYVQIPCIERNAVAAMRAINATNLARFLYINRKISFDAVIETMYKTGCDLKTKYRETSAGGLASLYEENLDERN